jgi:hypothetical protein
MSEDRHRVDELGDYEFVTWAETARHQLALHGHAFVSLSPGDATNYKIVVVQPLEPKIMGWIEATNEAVEGFEFVDQFWVGSSFGPIYQWTPGWHVTWDYVHEKWTQGRKGTDEWTARVICRFLNALSNAMKGES